MGRRVVCGLQMSDVLTEGKGETYWIERRGKLALGLRNWNTVSTADRSTRNNSPRNHTLHVNATHRLANFPLPSA